MFDPFFPLLLFAGPLALLVLLRVEAKRVTPTFLPFASSIGLALIAVWGLTYWGVVLGIAMFGEGMKEGELWKVTFPAFLASAVLVGLGYGLVARARTRAVAED